MDRVGPERALIDGPPAPSVPCGRHHPDYMAWRPIGVRGRLVGPAAPVGLRCVRARRNSDDDTPPPDHPNRPGSVDSLIIILVLIYKTQGPGRQVGAGIASWIGPGAQGGEAIGLAVDLEYSSGSSSCDVSSVLQWRGGRQARHALGWTGSADSGRNEGRVDVRSGGGGGRDRRQRGRRRGPHVDRAGTPREPLACLLPACLHEAPILTHSN